MEKTMKGISNSIDLGNNISLVYQKPEVFLKYLAVYYGEKYGDYYFRSSTDTLLEKAKIIDSGYLILKDNKAIGGVFLKPNFMSDLFTIPPFNDYGYIADKILEYLKTISDKNDKILLQEIVETHVPFYESRGCIVDQKGYWMIRPTESMEVTVPAKYESKPILEDDRDEIASLIVSAYKANPAFKHVYSKEAYANGIDNTIRSKGNNDVVYNSSRVAVCKDTGKIVGVSLHMEFENLPLITQIAVSPSHQGKGIGSYLIRHAINQTSIKYPAIRLYVFADNPAMKLYEYLGFIKNRTLNDMYIDK